MQRKYFDFHKHQYTWMAGILILCAILFRLFLMAHTWPPTDSEEGTMGLEAFHIAFRGEHPIYFYGQNYMGVSEAYLGAVMFRLFGVSVFSLRLGMLLLFTLFLVLLYLLASLLYGKKVACISLLLLVIGATNVLIPEMKAVGGAIETLVFGTAVMLLASWLALSSDANREDKKLLWQRGFAYSGWGIAAGLGLWSHLLVVPFVLCSGLLLILCCRRDIFSKNMLFLLLGLLIGAIPLIEYNIKAPIAENSIAVFFQLHNVKYLDAPSGITLLLKQLTGTFLFTLPIATGVPQIISNIVLPFYGNYQQQFLIPILLYTAWSLGYMLLLIYSSWNALKSIWLLRRKKLSTLDVQERRALILQTARLLLLACAWLTILSYASSATAAQRPWSYRYLVGLTATIPALIAPLMNNQEWFGRIKLLKSRYVNVVLLTIILIIPILGTLQDMSLMPVGDKIVQQQAELINTLERLKVSTIYSGYWICDAVIFQSQEKIICADLKPTMKPDLTRYINYKYIVAQSKRVAYVFTQNGAFHPQAVIDNFARNHKYYSEVQTDSYIIFVPVTFG